MVHRIELNDKNNTVIELSDKRILRYKDLIQNFINDFQSYIKYISLSDKKFFANHFKKKLFLYKTEIKSNQDLKSLYLFAKKVSKIKSKKKDYATKGIEFI